MLKNIKIENFYSINTQQELSFEILKKDILDDSARLSPLDMKKGINLVSCFIGPNASGKTNILKALTFLIWFTESGYSRRKEDAPTSTEPFKLNIKKPTNMEVEFFNDGELYKYFISLNSQKILAERLEKKKEKIFSYL